MTRKTATAEESARLKSLMEEDASTPPPTERLEAIRFAAFALQEAAAAVLLAEARVVEAKRVETNLEQNVLPALMAEAGIELLDLDEGTRIERMNEVYASISKENMARAVKWLDAHKSGGIVKTGFYIPLPKGALKLAKDIARLLRSKKIAFEESSSIHPQTLKAFVKETLEAEKPLTLPPEIKYHLQPIVVLKQTKKAKQRSN